MRLLAAEGIEAGETGSAALAGALAVAAGAERDAIGFTGGRDRVAALHGRRHRSGQLREDRRSPALGLSDASVSTAAGAVARTDDRRGPRAFGTPAFAHQA